jgi:serine/threonine protein kinase
MVCSFYENTYTVLYSRKDSSWKLADFGITCEATSQTLRSTDVGRGTPGYRAPELLNEDPVYNNKVDIWALGCILYELAVGEQAFANDFATREYKVSKTVLTVDLDGNFSDQCKQNITSSILAMLQKDSSFRPSAADLFEECRARYLGQQVPPPNSNTPSGNLRQSNVELVNNSGSLSQGNVSVFSKTLRLIY